MNLMNTILAAIMATIVSSYSGTAHTSAIGKQETQDSLILNVIDNDGVKSVSLDGYSAFGHDNISIRATLRTDDEGNIIEYKDVVITGIPAKLKTVTGKLTDTCADVTLHGKAAGLFKFEIRYEAKLQ